jgi:hypothetical protein
VSLVLACVAAAVAASAGLLVARRAASRPARPAPLAASPAPAAPDPFVGLPLALGDVVSADGEERWLAGALVVREAGRVVAAVLTAPEGARLHAVAVFPAPERSIWWLAPAVVEVPSEPPATLEIAGVALRRRGRVPVEVERVGQGAPSIASGALFATYEGGARDVAVVLVAGGVAHAWVGRTRDVGDYDRLGAGGTE